MRVVSILAVASALTLSACGMMGGEEEGEAQEVVPMGEAEIAAEMGETVMPLAGQYTATTELLEFSVPGVPDGMMDTMRETVVGELSQGHSFCLKEEDLAEGWKGFSEKMADGDCNFNRYNVNGDQLDAEMACKVGQTEGITTLQGTLGQESQDMTMRVEQNLPVGSVNMTMRMQSTRTGDCTE